MSYRPRIERLESRDCPASLLPSIAPPSVVAVMQEAMAQHAAPLGMTYAERIDAGHLSRVTLSGVAWSVGFDDLGAIHQAWYTVYQPGYSRTISVQQLPSGILRSDVTIPLGGSVVATVTPPTASTVIDVAALTAKPAVPVVDALAGFVVPANAPVKRAAAVVRRVAVKPVKAVPPVVAKKMGRH